jgi:hypothetical protein
VNSRFYGRPVAPRDVLSGDAQPPKEAEPLLALLACGLDGDNDDEPAQKLPTRPPPPPPSRANAPIGRPFLGEPPTEYCTQK